MEFNLRLFRGTWQEKKTSNTENEPQVTGIYIRLTWKHKKKATGKQ